jgi:hypothetical protein
MSDERKRAAEALMAELVRADFTLEHRGRICLVRPGSVEVLAHDGHLFVSPADRLTEDQMVRLREYGAELIEVATGLPVWTGLSPAQSN